MARRSALVTLCLLALLVARGESQNWGNQNSPQRERPCSTPNSKPGRCIAIQRCEPLLTILREHSPVSDLTLQFMRQSQCGFQGRNPIVCCSNDRANYPDPTNPWFEPPTTTTPRPTQPPRQTRPPTRPGTGGGAVRPPTRPGTVTHEATSAVTHANQRLLPTNDCGVDFTQRIFGGNLTALDEFPWTALLQYENKQGKKRFLCGGVLISKRYVLTAGHCSSKADLRGNRLVGVRLGEYNTETDRDCERDPVTEEEICNEPPQDFGIEQEVTHADYQAKSANQFNDIALLRLNADVVFNSAYIRPICIPTDNNIRLKQYIGDKLTVTGWGRTETRSSSPVKLKVSVPVVANAECGRIYDAKKRTITEKQLCAGGLKGQDSCSGDSGGPLMSQENKRFHVTGIVSYGPDPCGEAGWPGVYTRVAEYSTWIMDNIRP